MKKKYDVRDRLFKVISDFSESQREKPLHDLEKWEQPEPTEKLESKFPDKREHIRKDASIYGILQTKNSQFRVFTKNVSKGGVLIGSETPLSFGEDIFMTLFHKNFTMPIRTNGKVMRVDPDGVGVQFSQIIPRISSVY